MTYVDTIDLVDLLMHDLAHESDRSQGGKAGAEELIQKLLVAKPENPRQFLLNYLEKDLRERERNI